MKSIVFGILLILATSLTGISQTSKPNAQEQAVRQFINSFAAAFTANDTKTLDSLTASDYTFVAPNGDIQNKDQRYAPIKSGDLKYTSVKYTEVMVHLFGNTVTVTATVDVNSRLKGNDISGRFRSTLTLIKMTGKWMLVASQANKI